MKFLLLTAVLLGVTYAAPQFNNNGISPAMRTVLMDMLKNMMNTPGPSNFKVGAKPSLPALPPLPAPTPFKPAPSFMPPPPPPRPSGGNNGLLMDMPGGAQGGYGGPPMMRNFVYCPPGPTSSDACKDQKLQEALYYPDGTPRYNWVPPRNPWDSSIPDTVKDTAQNILMMKVNSRPNRTPTAKEWELMSLLGDPKEQGPAHTNPFAMGGTGPRGGAGRRAG